jgi:ABC-type glycerol-3-phosphate transport system substrate-binding protein
MSHSGFISALFGALLGTMLLSSCGAGRPAPVIIWTNRIELVSYAELFNASQDKAKVVAVYKENPAQALLEGDTGQAPDIVLGPELKNLRIQRYFRPLDYLFTEQRINRYAFYQRLLKQGEINGKQYILPVSFNLPAVIFDKANEAFVQENFMLTLDQMRAAAKSFNTQNQGAYTVMGFAPGWKPEFLYLTAKLKGARFQADKDTLAWDSLRLGEAVSYLRRWTLDSNTGTPSEQDFAFKYLYTPGYKQVTSGKCLFHYTSSEELFVIPREQLERLDFRWIQENNLIPAEDSGIFLGLHKKSNNIAAETFLTWLLNENTQQLLMERADAMKLDTVTFGIAGGFSTLRPVTERVFPAHYPSLLGNIPSPDYIAPPEVLPVRWESIKNHAVLPYLQSAVNTKNDAPPQTLAKLLDEWRNQYF